MQGQHRGAAPTSPFPRQADRRILDLIERDATHLPLATAAYGLLADPYRAIQNQLGFLGDARNAGRISIGCILHAIPYVNWYKVQTVEFGYLGCCLSEPSGFVPVGVRATSPLPPGSIVLLYKASGLDYGMILGVLPPLIRQGQVVCPDWLVQGGGSGLKREQAHMYPIKNMEQEGGVKDFSANRPLDATSLEWGRMASTGVGILIDDFQAYLRVNEMCGLFLNYFDSHARLTGVNLDVLSAIHEDRARDDEGECRLFRGVASFPWEAVGLYAPGIAAVETYDDQAVQYSAPVGKIDVPAAAPDAQPIYRWQEHHGYNGHMRLLMVPPSAAGLRRLSDKAVDEGLFCENISQDGAYSLHSAKSLYIGKRCRIVVPKEISLPENGNGDDAGKNNYKASGVWGSGAEHKVHEVTAPTETVSLLKAAAVLDLIAHTVNWKTLHAFHYHQADYRTAQEKAQTAHFSRTQEALDFAALREHTYLDEPTPIPLRIDARYDDIQYFERESFLVFHDDGSVQLGSGCGSRLLFSGGKIRVDCPGDFEVAPGRDLIVLAGQGILRFKNDVDVTSARGELRLKAERNLQVLAGNSGTGALLLESKGVGVEQQYANRVGTEVSASGIVLRSAAGVGLLGNELYLRSLNGGSITIDADQGNGVLQLYAGNCNVYASANVNLYLGAVDDNSNVTAAYVFTPNVLACSGRLVASQGLLVSGSNSQIVADGSIFITGSLGVGGSIGSHDGGLLGKVEDGFSDQIRSETSEAEITLNGLVSGGGDTHASDIVPLYGENRLGNEDTIAGVHFTYRDHGEQYGTADDFTWLEARWQQMARLGLGRGGVPWVEPPVQFESSQLYPWPGRELWLEDTVMLRLAQHTMFDASAGSSKDRPGPYEDPLLADWSLTTMANSYTMIR